MKAVAIIDYGMGNLGSVSSAVRACGGSPLVTERPHDIESADRIILPGVGAFSDGMRKIREKKLEGVLSEQVLKDRKPFLGLCLGMELLASKGFEGGETAGLGWMEGEVKRLEPDEARARVPHMGWNDVIYQKPSAIFQDIPSGKPFYFAHSYHLICKDEGDVLAYTPYCGRLVSAISRGNIFGVQFHPEKSQGAGLRLIGNFLKL